MRKIIIYTLSGVLCAGSAISFASTQPGKSANKTLMLKMPASKAPAPISEQANSDLILEINGNIYPRDQFPGTCKDLFKGAACTEPSFGHYHVEAKKEGDLVHSKAVFNDPEGPQVLEESWEKDGHVQRAVIENRALKRRSEIEVKDGKVHYKMTDLKDGSVKTSTDDLDSNLVVPSTVMSYIRPYHEALKAGEPVKLRVAVMDRQEAFSFNIKKVRTEKALNGDEIMVLEMSPGSIIVKALVDPMYFYIRVKTGEMFAFEGKSALRRKEGEKYKDLIVKAAYEYKVNQLKVAAGPQLKNGCTEEMLKLGTSKCSVQENGAIPGKGN